MAAKYLLSTLWTQDSEGDYEYNTYCPIDTYTNVRSLVGCVALMHAQILYYWAEQGTDISLTLTSDDAYITSTRRINITGNYSSTYDYGVFSEMNTLLESLTVGDQDDIAALCYACGVLVDIDYTSSATSGTLTDDVYERAGFDSYNIISSTTNTLFFTTSGNMFFSTTTISDAGWEIIQDNLNKGYVIAVASNTLSHALLMDGYNSDDGTYHLNFGWGSSDSKAYNSSYGCYTGTGWYTESEIDKLSISGLGIDIYPDYDGSAFTVSSTGTYGVNTLYRAIEQAGAVQSGGIVNMAESMSSKKIALTTVLPETASDLTIQNLYGDIRIQISQGTGYGSTLPSTMSSAKGLTIQNLAGNIAAVNSSSSVITIDAADTLKIEKLSGAVVANCAGTSYAIYSDTTVSLLLESGGIFAGTYTVTQASGESAVTNIFTALGNFSTEGVDALAKINDCGVGYAIYSGSGNDVVTLTENSSVVGCVYLGGGTNTVTIENGSYLRSYLFADDDSLSLNLILSGNASDTPFLSLYDITKTSYGRSTTYYGVEALAESLAGDISVDVSAASKGTYILFSGASTDAYADLEFDLGNDIILSLNETTESGNYILALDGTNLVLTVTDAPLCATGLTVDSTGVRWLAPDAEAVTGYTVEFSTDDFATGVMLHTSSTAVDTVSLTEGVWQWRVRVDNSDAWAVGDEIVVSAPVGDMQILQAETNDAGDVFFATATKTWGKNYGAQHNGNIDGWSGTKEIVVVEGKNKITDIFLGSNDISVLFLTDDENGDALCLEDNITNLEYDLEKDQARLGKINEIRAGNGDDVVDMTSQTVAYMEDGMIIRGGNGNDTIWANSGSNSLFGDCGNDRLVGASGDDFLIGGSGDDSMHGGGGNDIFIFCSDWGNDIVEQTQDGTVTLWFESGDSSKWDTESFTYVDGDNTVTISGIDADKVTLKFGDDDSELYDTLVANGAFDAFSSDTIANSDKNGIIVSV